MAHINIKTLFTLHELKIKESARCYRPTDTFNVAEGILTIFARLFLFLTLSTAPAQKFGSSLNCLTQASWTISHSQS